MLDISAAQALTRYRCPWLVDQVEWTDPLTRKAVIWLARLLKKPILKLTEEDYNEEGLQDLLAEHGPAYDINVQVFRHLQHTITAWQNRITKSTLPTRHQATLLCLTMTL